ncbi:hypothetical protein F4861DRAFT_509164 [Xylaria intraflava]|nr:hypothetical protein F4861DRAFT_509164 [Xylaria intraflava]
MPPAKGFPNWEIALTTCRWFVSRSHGTGDDYHFWFEWRIEKRWIANVNKAASNEVEPGQKARRFYPQPDEKFHPLKTCELIFHLEIQDGELFVGNHVWRPGVTLSRVNALLSVVRLRRDRSHATKYRWGYMRTAYIGLGNLIVRVWDSRLGPESDL